MHNGTHAAEHAQKLGRGVARAARGIGVARYEVQTVCEESTLHIFVFFMLGGVRVPVMLRKGVSS